jgi:hypothetical protein
MFVLENTSSLKPILGGSHQQFVDPVPSDDERGVPGMAVEDVLWILPSGAESFVSRLPVPPDLS